MIELNWTLYVQLINYLVLVFLLNMVLFRPIRGAIKDRRAKMDAFETDITSLTEKNSDLQNSIQAEVLAARKSGIGKRDMLKQEGSAMEATLIDNTKKDIEGEWSRTEQKIKEDMAAARQALQPQAQVFASELAAKIMGREMA